VPYVIAEHCVDIQDLSCVEECPVDCIYEGPRSNYINQDECIDCGACQLACPTDAIYYAPDLPAEYQAYQEASYEVFRALGRPAPGGARKVGPLPADAEVVAALPARGQA